MKTSLVFGALFFYSSFANAYLYDFNQSSSSVGFDTISNDSVQLIYPKSSFKEGVYVANLVRHYSRVVGKTYGIVDPEKFTLIVRPEVAQPNGFVTLGPRRSEWFAASTFTPFVGSSEWFQTLSIHEYRHVNQFDYFKSNRGTTAGLRILLGDTGQQLAMFLGLHPWFFEGDAVWAETKYTDAGRGRSPRFLSRLKALVTGDQIPSYDEFVNGTYKTRLPNWYVYGYVLVSRATQKFGDEFWADVIYAVADLPHPFRIYSQFEKISGQSFEDFYQETMDDLKKQWAADAAPEKREEYTQEIYPFQVGSKLYYLHSDLNSYWTLRVREGSEDSKVTELPFSFEINQIHLSEKNAVYAQFLPHARYAFKGYSDLFLINLDGGGQTKLTSGQRLYNPRFNPAGNKIIAVRFNEDQTWEVVEFDLKGNELQHFAMEGYKPAELAYIDDSTAYALLNNVTGHKSIVEVDLKSHRVVKEVLPPSRNNLSTLNVDSNQSLFFEAQYKGHVDVFSTDRKGGFSRCTQSKISAISPSSNGKSLVYSVEVPNGNTIQKTELTACKTFDKAQLTHFNYLDQSPSDNYNHFPITEFNDQIQMHDEHKDEYQPEAYGDLDSQLFIPHSWSLLGARGWELLVTTDNYLRTMSITADVGHDTEEKRNFGSLSIEYRRFYPVFSLTGGVRERFVDFFGSSQTLEWSEKNAGLTMVIPYVHRRGYWNTTAALHAEGEYVSANDYEQEDVALSLNDRQFRIWTGGLDISFYKDQTYRMVQAPWLLSYGVLAQKAESFQDPRFSSFRVLQQAKLQIPSLFTNHGFKFTYSRDQQRALQSAYKFLPMYDSVSSYAFSRGYGYQSIPEFDKWTANYAFPIANTDWALGGWYYLRRLKGNVFFDSTRLLAVTGQPKYESYGAELELEGNFFRRIPLELGVRHSHRIQRNSGVWDVYFGIGANL